MQLNFTLVVGVSSFIESCSWGLRSIRRMGKSDSAAEVKVTEHFDDGSVIEHPADLGLFFFFFQGLCIGLNCLTEACAS